MDVIQCYAPTNGSNDDEKEKFYSRLSTVIQNCPRRNIAIMMGDINAKIGSDNTGHEEIKGERGIGEMNDNDERFVFEQPDNWRKCLQAQKDTQFNLGIT